MSKQDGGSAFPQVKTTKEYVTDPDVHSVGGMSLRDYFAAKAMAAIISNPAMMREVADESNEIATAVSISAQAYIAADAMLRERAK